MSTLRNPFSDTALLNQHIEPDTLAEIFLQACEYADVRARHERSIHRDLGLGNVCSLVRRYRWDAPPMHPATIRHRFRGATTSVLLTISELYCDRVDRSISSVIEIMQGFADEAGTDPLDPMAVWALCTYFDERKREKLEPTIELRNDCWRIEMLRPPIWLSDSSGARFAPEIIVVVDDANGYVIASHVDRPESKTSNSLCLYAAIVGQRRPSAAARSGVKWRLPSAIYSGSESIINTLHSHCLDFPFEVDAKELEPGSPAAQTIENLRGDWTSDLDRHAIPLKRFENVLDNFLWRFYDNGPQRTQRENAAAYSSLIGYAQDPGDIYPALRRLLPIYPSRIEAGQVYHNGLTYEDPLLRLWPDRDVLVTPSLAAEAHAWISMGGNVVCKASALQLRRKDGSYRPYREGDWQ